MNPLYTRRFPLRTLTPGGELTTEIANLPYHAINFRHFGTVTTSGAITAKNPYGAFELLDRVDVALGGEEVIHIRGADLQVLCEFLNGGVTNELIATTTGTPFRASAHLDFTKLMPNARLFAKGDQKLEVRARGAVAAFAAPTYQGYGDTVTTWSSSLQCSGYSWGGTPQGAIPVPRIDFTEYELNVVSSAQEYTKVFTENLVMPFALVRVTDRATQGNNRHPDGLITNLKLTLHSSRFQTPVILSNNNWMTYRDLSVTALKLPHDNVAGVNSQRTGVIGLFFRDMSPEGRSRGGAMQFLKGDTIVLEVDTASAPETGITDVVPAAEDRMTCTWCAFKIENAVEEPVRRGSNPMAIR